MTTTTIKLKKCFCGEIPTSLSIEEGSSCKYSWVSGSCCLEWSVQFRTTYTNDDELMRLAVNAWNNATRE